MLRLNFILNVYKEIFEKNDTAIAARSLIQRDIPWNINNSIACDSCEKAPINVPNVGN